MTTQRQIDKIRQVGRRRAHAGEEVQPAIASPATMQAAIGISQLLEQLDEGRGGYGDGKPDVTVAMVLRVPRTEVQAIEPRVRRH